MSLRKMGSITSSSEDYENRSGGAAIIADEKKKRRMLSNRESARRSRMKRQQYIKDLNDQVAYFRTKNIEIDTKCKDMMDRYVGVESENKKLRKQGEELKKRLEMLEDSVQTHQERSYDSFLQELLVEEPWLQIQPPYQQYQAVDGT